MILFIKLNRFMGNVYDLGVFNIVEDSIKFLSGLVKLFIVIIVVIGFDNGRMIWKKIFVLLVLLILVFLFKFIGMEFMYFFIKYVFIGISFLI